MSSMPGEEYAQRLTARELLVASLDKLHVRIGNFRLLLAVAAVIVGWWSIRMGAFSPWWLVLPVVGFAVAVVYHSRVLQSRSRAERAADVYREGLARIQDRWTGRGIGGERFEAAHHVYAADLDLFGEGSLFELLSRARTRMGEEALARWLLRPSNVEDIRERHAAVAELRDLLDFREDLAVLTEVSRVGVHPERLLKWAEGTNQLQQRWLQWLAPVLAVCAVVAAIAWAIWGIATPFVVTIVLEGSINYSLRKKLTEILDATEHAFEDLDLLSALLSRLERERFGAARLQYLAQELKSHDVKASRAIARLRTVVQFVESRHNQFVRLLNVPLLYSIQVAFRAEAWRGSHGHKVRAWLDIAGEIEALGSLATYSYEHPADVFPEFVSGPASFEAEEICHPLIPAAECVANSVALTGNTKVLLVSGSNMSGKSTLLRTVGMNTVLAMAGAPVRARRLQMTPLQTAASIRINDSLHEGNSRFYAEITRLRQIYDLSAQERPVLFLLDELLQGTNSNDRRIGAEGVIQAFVERGAIGLISTHDLALTEVGGQLNGALHNFHFQDEIENGKMLFDFKLREGVVTKSNALELMRSIGLNV